MAQHGEPVDKHAPARQTPLRHIKIRLTFFFDGTGNNRLNVQTRELVARRPGYPVGPDGTVDEPVLRAQIALGRYGGDDTSYANDQTNVVRLYENAGDLNAAKPEYDYYVKVYIEGIGTVNQGSDSTRGYALGSGTTGVVGKVNRGIAMAINRLNQLPFDRRTTIVDLITVDTCGFSRGAASARYCIYRVLADSQNEPETGPSTRLKALLERAGWQVSVVRVRACGLFDTVSSYGIAYSGNVATLKLNAVRAAEAVYQLAAAEEYRARFSLTDITSAGAKGKQVYLPGAHSDIGGSYVDGAGEHKVLMNGPASGDVSDFLRARGWYRGDAELVHNGGRGVQQSLVANRSAIRNKYTLIPLRLMAKWLREQSVPVLPILFTRFNPGHVPGREEIEHYAATVAPGKSRPTDWEGIDPLRAALRHDFLHISFSANSVGDRLGKTVRVVNDGTFWRPHHRPTREVVHG